MGVLPSDFMKEHLVRLRATKDNPLSSVHRRDTRHPYLPNHLVTAFVSLPMSVWIAHFGAPFRWVFWMLTVEDSCCSQHSSPSLWHPFFGLPHPCSLSHPYSESGTRAPIPLSHSLSLQLSNEILYLWHPALSPRTKPLLRQKGKPTDGSTEAGERRAVRGGGEAPVPEGFISCPDRLLFFQVGRWIFYLLKLSSSR